MCSSKLVWLEIGEPDDYAWYITHNFGLPDPQSMQASDYTVQIATPSTRTRGNSMSSSLLHFRSSMTSLLPMAATAADRPSTNPPLSIKMSARSPPIAAATAVAANRSWPTNRTATRRMALASPSSPHRPSSSLQPCP